MATQAQHDVDLAEQVHQRGEGGAAVSGVIVLLGSPNSDQGRLHSVALERCKRALDVYRERVGSKILPTGGFGPHFNTTDRPHAWYLKTWLVAHGVPQQDVLPFAESRNTIEDATLSYEIARRCGAGRAIIVTSDYHAPRARYVFERVYHDIALEFAICATDAEQCDLDLIALQAHEREALAQLEAQGLPLTEGDNAISHPGQNGTTGL